jgi:hypothetical protein
MGWDAVFCRSRNAQGSMGIVINYAYADSLSHGGWRCWLLAGSRRYARLNAYDDAILKTSCGVAAGGHLRFAPCILTHHAILHINESKRQSVTA